MKAIGLLFISLCVVLQAQPTISGVINDYSKVTYVDVPCNYVTAQVPAYFSVGDRVLLIQMKGADVITTANLATYGDLTSINNAGNYEFNEITFIDVDKLYMKYTMRGYTAPAGAVQVIRVPQYSDVVINGLLTADPWDGDKGGVLVFEASGTVTMSADIDVSNIGFRKGQYSIAGGACTFTTPQREAYEYNSITSSDGAQKGEGATVTPLPGGRGKQLNGGGGGNNHNNGGGGGGNFGNGGNGGNKSNQCAGTYISVPGIGGASLSTNYTTLNKIFLGGGGGGGQQNNNVSQPAGSGGGIVIISAAQIVGNNYKMMANGEFGGSVLDYAFRHVYDHGDGAGGGGAGGAILINTNSTNISQLQTEAKGAQGSYTCYLNRNFGPGGGGGGGVVWIKDALPSANVTTDVSAGLAGLSIGVTATQTWGATNGTAGGTLSNLSIPQNAVFALPGGCGVALPISLLSYSATPNGSSVALAWNIISDDERYFVLERGDEAFNFQQVGTVYKTSSAHYSYRDNMPYTGTSYYRLSYVNTEGRKIYLGVRRVNMENAGHQLSLVPNPSSSEVFVDGIIETTSYSIHTIAGQEIFSGVVNPGEALPVSALPTGVYLLSLTNTAIAETHRLVRE